MLAAALPWERGEEGTTVTQRSVEILIGRLVTDEEFRQTFRRDPQRALDQLLERGLDLTPAEIGALMNTGRELWDRVADELDPRLQKANLKS
jgi:hypothetical protein